MTLSEYIKSRRGMGVQLAAALGISPSYLSQLVVGNIAPAMCVSIERATQGDVRRWDLRPKDWHRIWPELIGSPGAPELSAQVA